MALFSERRATNAPEQWLDCRQEGFRRASQARDLSATSSSRFELPAHRGLVAFRKVTQKTKMAINYRWRTPGLAVFTTKYRCGSPHRGRPATWDPLETRQIF